MDGDIRPDVPRNIDTEHCVMARKTPVTAAMEGNNGRGRWAGQTQQILTETCTLIVTMHTIITSSGVDAVKLIMAPSLKPLRSV